MNIALVILFLVFVASFIGVITAKTELARLFWGVPLLFSMLGIFTICWRGVGVPLSIDDSISRPVFYPAYLPFADGKMFQVCWKSKKGEEYLFSVECLFSVSDVVKTKTGMLPEIFSRKTPIPALFVVIDGEIHSIDDGQKDEILKKNCDIKQIRKILYLE
jgi:hypothetical protein